MYKNIIYFEQIVNLFSRFFSKCVWNPYLWCLMFKDSTYVHHLAIPVSGLTLKTRVFAAVKATNLDRR